MPAPAALWCRPFCLQRRWLARKRRRKRAIKFPKSQSSTRRFPKGTCMKRRHASKILTAKLMVGVVARRHKDAIKRCQFVMIRAVYGAVSQGEEVIRQ